MQDPQQGTEYRRLMMDIRQFTAQKTPSYVFDLEALKERITKLNALKADNSRLCYAMKANPFLIGPMEAQMDRFEVCSPGELEICKACHIPAEKIVFSGVNKRKEEIVDAVSYGVGVITLESVQQYEYVKACARELQKKVRVMPRLTGGGQFGMEKEELEQIVSACQDGGLLEVVGVHYFTGTQKKKVEKIIEEAGFLMEYCGELREKLGFAAQILEFGTGMAVPYFEGDDFEGEYAPFEKFADFLRSEGRGYQWTLEFGRYIAAPCGNYVTTVVDMKKNHGVNYCLVDGGIHHLNYYGQNMAMRVPKITHVKAGKAAQYMEQGSRFEAAGLGGDADMDLRTESAAPAQEWCVCGSLCTFADVLVRRISFADLQVGDALVFHNAGAYSVTEAIHLLLSRNMPQIFFYSKADGMQRVRGAVETWRLNREDAEG